MAMGNDELLCIRISSSDVMQVGSQLRSSFEPIFMTVAARPRKDFYNGLLSQQFLKRSPRRRLCSNPLGVSSKCSVHKCKDVRRRHEQILRWLHVERTDQPIWD